MNIFSHFYKNLSPLSPRNRVPMENWVVIFQDFPIQIAENLRVVPIFVGPKIDYLESKMPEKRFV